MLAKPNTRIKIDIHAFGIVKSLLERTRLQCQLSRHFSGELLGCDPWGNFTFVMSRIQCKKKKINFVADFSIKSKV